MEVANFFDKSPTAICRFWYQLWTVWDIHRRSEDQVRSCVKTRTKFHYLSISLYDSDWNLSVKRIPIKRYQKFHISEKAGFLGYWRTLSIQIVRNCHTQFSLYICRWMVSVLLTVKRRWLRRNWSEEHRSSGTTQ